MPTDAENTLFLFLILTSDGAASINWPDVGNAMDLKPGAVSKRWSRLKQSIAKGDAPSASSYQFLWFCTKFSNKDSAPNWDAIAATCNTTPGAASKRYSRMKQAFEQGGPPPSAAPRSPAVKNTPTKPKATPKKATGGDEATDAPTPTPKRKRATPKKKAVPENSSTSPSGSAHPEDDAQTGDEYPQPKRAKPSAVNVTPKPEPNPKLDTPISEPETAQSVKHECVDDEDVSHEDAHEHEHEHEHEQEQEQEHEYSNVLTSLIEAQIANDDNSYCAHDWPADTV